MAKQRRISEEEQQFTAWLVDAKEHGLVDRWEEQPDTFNLLPKAEISVGAKKPKFLFHPHSYTADFCVVLTSRGQDVLADAFSPAHLTQHWKEGGVLWIDTKGSFTVQHGQEQMFQVNRKLIWHLHKIYISKVIPWISQRDRHGRTKDKPKKCLFSETYCPKSLILRKDLRLSSMGLSCQDIGQFIKSQETLWPSA